MDVNKLIKKQYKIVDKVSVNAADSYVDDFKIVVSDTQMYRQAGNSIIVDVLIALLKEMDITEYGR